MRKKSGIGLVYIILVLVFLYLPMLCVAVYSFNVSKSTAVWGGFTLDWYGQLAKDRDLLSALGVSLRVGALVSLVSVVLGTLGASALARSVGRFAKIVQNTLYLPLVIPEVVLGVALMSLFAGTALSGKMAALVLAHSTFCVPYVFILVSIRLRTVAPSVYEAARDLGASPLAVFRTVTLPLALPAIGSAALLAFAMSLDDVVISFFVSGPKSQTLPLLIFSAIRLGITPKINALCTIILTVTFLVVGVTRITARARADEHEETKAQ